MDTTKDVLLGRWQELKDPVRKRWSKLTNDDFTRLHGKTEELVVLLQQRYGYGKVQAEIEINKWLREHDRQEPLSHRLMNNKKLLP